MSRGLYVQIDVLGLAQEVVYLLHRAKRAHFLLRALGHDPSGCARRFSRPRVHDVRVTVGIYRVRPGRGRTEQFRHLDCVYRVRVISRIVPRGLQFRVFEIDVRISLGIDGRSSAVRSVIPRYESLNRLRLTGGIDGCLRTIRGCLESGRWVGVIGRRESIGRLGDTQLLAR